MNMRNLFQIISNLVLVLFLTISNFAASAEVLDVKAYLDQVRSRNAGVQGSLKSGEGAALHSAEAHLVTTPQFFTQFQYTSDAKLPGIPIFTYDKLRSQFFSFGFTEQTSFGLQAKLAYDVAYTSYVGAFVPFYDARPYIEVSMPLWGNGFGRGVRATRDLLESQALATSYSSRFQARSLILGAESAYWRLSLQRDQVEIQKSAFTQAEKIYEWSNGRARKNLGDRSDALQAKAALELRQLELQAAQDAEREAARGFNLARGMDSDVVSEKLVSVDSKNLLKAHAPERAENRDDVKAAREQQKAVNANLQKSIERNRPQLDVFALTALNGRSGDLSDTLSNSTTTSRPTYSIGLKFSMPLAFGSAGDAKNGMVQEQDGADLAYQQRWIDQEQGWKDLLKRLEESKKRLSLSVSIVKSQEAKLSYERQRLKQGRTTTFQVLLFEQDYSQAQLGQLRNQSELIQILTQMKLYGETL